MRIILGLGNPGEKYKITRHNVGFTVLDKLAEEFDSAWENNKKFKAEIAMTPLIKEGEGGFVLAKPQTFMNLSGDSAQKILNFYKIKENELPEKLTVIHDDLDIEFGKFKISVNRASAGHNGVQSIIDKIGTKNFKRVRVGIKTAEREKIPAEKFVLGKFKKKELGILEPLIAKIIEEIKRD